MTMTPPSFSTIVERNKEYSKSPAAQEQVAVFVGATSGLGEHTAYAFAKYIKQPTIYIVGRNAQSGARVLERLKELNPNPEAKYHFLQHDVTLISEADKLSKTIAANESKINLLFLSPGFLTTRGRTETVEGIDSKLAINYYGRWRIIENLLPLVVKANNEVEQDTAKEGSTNSRPNARVVSLLTPGNEGPVIENDLGLVHNYSLANANRHITEFTSLAVARFAEKYPSIGFLHAGPGIVNTGIMRELPWYVRFVATPIMFFASKPEDAAERFFYISTNNAYRTGYDLLMGNLKSVKEKMQDKGYLSKELQEKVWNHTEDTFKQALEKDSK